MALTPEALARAAQLVLDYARDGGATGAEAQVATSRGYSVSVRQQAVESLEFQHDREMGVTVYVGHRKGAASTGDLSDAGLQSAVSAALDIARVTGEDPCNGLADPHRLASVFPDLDLDHPWDLQPPQAIEQALATEAAALAVDPRIRQSEGAALSTHRTLSLYANSHGFIGHRQSTSHGLNCAVVAVDGDDMQRDYWYTHHRRADQLESAESVGREAGQRAVRRLGARKLTTRTAPVLFPPELARSLFGAFIGAISGGALYRRASFLLDALEQPVFPEGIDLLQRPLLPGAAASSAFDSEGVATEDRSLVERGVLKGWLLGSYSARRMGLQSTGNAGGVFNLLVEGARQTPAQLMREMGTGLVVSELLGHGVNGVTGDYSRGAAGFWVENGEIAYPVDELTIAGNLREMFRQIVGLGDDLRPYASIRTGSVVIDGLTLAA